MNEKLKECMDSNSCGHGFNSNNSTDITNCEFMRSEGDCGFKFDNNPTPLEALNVLSNRAYDYVDIRYNNKKVKETRKLLLNDCISKHTIVEQALTDYNKQNEMLEGLREKYRTKLRASYIVREAVYRKTLIDCIADITKVLEGKVNE
jgi:hypothetical protein